MNYKYKSIPIAQSLKDVDTKTGVVAGYAAAFDNVDSDGDIIERGAFKKTVAENGPNGKNRIKMLFNHDWNKILGKPSVLKEDDHGLYFESKISTTSYGRDVLTLYEDNIIDMHSIGFNVVVDEFNKEKEVRHLKELKLYEYSPVAWGANEETPFRGWKTAEDKKYYLDRLDKLMKLTRKDLTDETHFMIEAQIMQLIQGIKDFISGPEIVTTREPGADLTQSELIKMLAHNTKLMKGEIQ
jgi:HK97 family phage prohead protease